jgi:hypothetical protein
MGLNFLFFGVFFNMAWNGKVMVPDDVLAFELERGH